MYLNDYDAYFNDYNLVILINLIIINVYKIIYLSITNYVNKIIY